MEFIEAPAFTRYRSDYRGEDECRALQKLLGLGPELTRAKPNPQAIALFLLVRRYPDTLEWLEKLAAG
jgi:hypothetical protein